MCPTCKSTSVRRSRSHHLRDRIMKLAGMIPYRCRDCQKRFFVNTHIDGTLQREKRRAKEIATHLAASAQD